MREYGKIAPEFWIGTTGRTLRGCLEAQVVAAYLISSPHANMLGLYYLPVPYIAHDTGLTIEGASKGLQRCIEAGFCAFDDATEVVWVFRMVEYQVGDDLKAKDKRCKGVQSEYDRIPTNPFLAPFFERHGKRFHMTFPREFAKPLQSPIEAPTMPGAGAGTGTRTSPPLRSGDVCAEAKKPPAAPPALLPPEPALLTLPCVGKGPREWPVTQSHLDDWATAFPGVDVLSEVRKLRLWLQENPRRKKTFSGVGSCVLHWLGIAQNRARPTARASPRDAPSRTQGADESFRRQIENKQWPTLSAARVPGGS